jgi:hypothetical protein
MRNAVKKIPPQKLISLNTLVRKNKIIFDSIIHRDYMIQYMNQYLTESDPTKTQKEILQSLEKRMSDLNVIDKEYLYVGSEIYIVDTHLFILNWKDETCIEIKNQEMVSLIKGLFMFAKNHSIKINYHEFIARHLSKITL